MNALRRVWEHFEEGFIAFLLAAMTLITFVYVILNNFYTLFYWLGDHFGGNEFLLGIGDAILDMAQAMTWSISLTKALFAWLIFFGIAYGVRTAGHIGVDALVKLATRPVQRIIGLIACLACLFYAGLIGVASYDWVATLFKAALATAHAFGKMRGLGDAAVARMGEDLVFDAEAARRDFGYAPRGFNPTASMFELPPKGTSPGA